MHGMVHYIAAKLLQKMIGFDLMVEKIKAKFLLRRVSMHKTIIQLWKIVSVIPA